MGRGRTVHRIRNAIVHELQVHLYPVYPVYLYRWMKNKKSTVVVALTHA